MSARRTTARFSLAAALVASICLGGAAASASAEGEPDGLYSVQESEGMDAFVELDTTDATPTTLGTPTDAYEFESVELFDGIGYAIGSITGDSEDAGPAVFTWDVATGAVLTSVPVVVPEVGVLDRFNALDMTTDGTLLAYMGFVIDDSEFVLWIVSIDPVTGAVTPLVDTSLVEDNRIFEGIATNPVTGVTFALADYDDGVPAYSPVDLEAGTVGDSIFFESIAASLGAGYFQEGDFDASGVLWFNYSGAGVARSNAPIEVGVAATELGDPDVESKAITVGEGIVGPAPAPQLAATGFPVAPVIGGAAALLLAGIGLTVVRRRATV